MSMPKTDRRLQWCDDPSVLLEDLRTCYSMTEKVIGRGGHLLKKQDQTHPDDYQELQEEQKQWQGEVAHYALKLLMFRNDMTAAFAAQPSNDRRLPVDST